MVAPGDPAMVLLQADGRHEMDTPNAFNDGDAGDPFPGTANIVKLGDDGRSSTSFPGSDRSGIELTKISADPITREISLDITIS
jgi:hypothetical protein